MLPTPTIQMGPIRISSIMCCGLIVTICGVMSCGKKESAGDEEKSVAAVVPVRATTVITGDVPERLIVTGHTEAVARERLVSPIAGKLLSITGTEGSYVAV